MSPFPRADSLAHDQGESGQTSWELSCAGGLVVRLLGAEGARVKGRWREGVRTPGIAPWPGAQVPRVETGVWDIQGVQGVGSEEFQ